MWGFDRAAEERCMTSSSCCGAPTRGISIDMRESSLSFRYCERCESRQWFRDGRPVTLTSVKEQATQEWNKKAQRAAVPVPA
jgi:hypothetical protein